MRVEVNGEARIICSHLGCQQGDPLGPLYFAVAAAFLLFYPDGVNATPGSMPAYGHSTAETPAPHCAFLDDLNVLQAAYFDDAAAAGVAEVICRLAAGGLRVGPDKSLAIAMRGTVFDEAARARLRALDIPFVDATMPESSQGFTSVGAAAAAATVPGPQAAAAAASSTPAKTQTSAEESSCSGGQEDDDDDWEAYADEICRKDCLVEDLEAASAGAVGKLTQATLIGDSRDTSRRRQQASARVLAQLRSQRASGAMAWMSVPPAANDRPGAAPMSTSSYLTGKTNASNTDGYAAGVGEDAKRCCEEELPLILVLRWIQTLDAANMYPLSNMVQTWGRVLLGPGRTVPNISALPCCSAVAKLQDAACASAGIADTFPRLSNPANKTATDTVTIDTRSVGAFAGDIHVGCKKRTLAALAKYYTQPDKLKYVYPHPAGLTLSTVGDLANSDPADRDRLYSNMVKHIQSIANEADLLADTQVMNMLGRKNHKVTLQWVKEIWTHRPVEDADNDAKIFPLDIGGVKEIMETGMLHHMVESWAHHTGKTVYSAPQSLYNWVGYAAQDIAIIDDMVGRDRNNVSKLQLRLYEHHTILMNEKYAKHAQVQADHIVIISNDPPCDVEALCSRLRPIKVDTPLVKPHVWEAAQSAKMKPLVLSATEDGDALVATEVDESVIYTRKRRWTATTNISRLEAYVLYVHNSNSPIAA
ncbi:hypothetical protein JKP88DRAFT_283918 [Tribonema minus]|uniref:Uncharacterized protein n=1 Tax=Tribonema minus TaxID=303371 RepID=A0A835YGR0_9STRA|nr:hypothetical protein JKP88DRAFT_283918 [Tribonema minus]